MKVIGVLLILIGVLGGWRGPVDPYDAEDWIVFVLCIAITLVGVWTATH